MRLDEYFENAKGVGVLATSDAEGKVNMAIYSRPHFLAESDQELAFIMADHLSHANLQANPQAAFLFIEEGEGYRGTRLSLTKIREETDQEKIRSVRRPEVPKVCAGAEGDKRFLVHFQVEEVRPLVGQGETLASHSG